MVNLECRACMSTSWYVAIHFIFGHIGLEGVHFTMMIYALLIGYNLNYWDCMHGYKCHAGFTFGYTLYYDIQRLTFGYTLYYDIQRLTFGYRLLITFHTDFTLGYRLLVLWYTSFIQEYRLLFYNTQVLH